MNTAPGVQAQHCWFEARTSVRDAAAELSDLVGTPSHSGARFEWVSREATQLAWRSSRLELFRRYLSVPFWVRIDNLKTRVAPCAGPTPAQNPSYRVFAQTCGFQVNPCRPTKGSDKERAEPSVRTFRDVFGDLFRNGWTGLEPLRATLKERAHKLARRRKSLTMGTSVAET